MRKKQPFGLSLILFTAILSFNIFSCSTIKNVKYFQDLPDSTKGMTVNSAAYKDPVIQSDDIMSIVIQTIDPQTSAVVNQVAPSLSVGASSASPIGNQQIVGLLVDKEGIVEIPLIGKVKIVGLTTYEARELIRKRASVYFKDPSVQVRFANFKITVIGEVVRPATYTMANEKVSVLDALGLAGDLTIYGKRDNVLLIRDDSVGQKKLVRLNLNSSNLFKDPNYYLRQNDVLYVEPNKAKIASSDAAKNRIFTIVGAAIGLLVIVASRVKF